MAQPIYFWMYIIWGQGIHRIHCTAVTQASKYRGEIAGENDLENIVLHSNEASFVI